MDRSETGALNADIYKNFPKADIERLTDEEFRRLWDLFHPHISFDLCGKLFPDLRRLPDTEGKNEKNVMGLYRRVAAADENYTGCMTRYRAFFSLGEKLGLTCFYDIGCGSFLQGLMLARKPACSYIGIDVELFHSYLDHFDPEPEEINEILYPLWGDRIVYLRKKYPFPIEAEARHLAILSNVITPFMNHDKVGYMDPFWSTALNRDFTRLIVTANMHVIDGKGKDVRDVLSGDVNLYEDISGKAIRFWKNVLPGFRLFRLAKSGFLFATKHEEDLSALRKHFLLQENEIYFTDL